MLLAERYRTSEILGHGGMGEVYRACDELLGRPVAVKLLRPDRRDPFATARFQREARAAAMVKHPQVVAVYDFGHCNGEYYLVMELVEGHSVTQELALRGPLDPERATRIIRQAAAGLTAAHRHDIVHRDIKPDNLLIDADGTVKVADFGIARSPLDNTTTIAGQILGTSHYLAPERARGEPATAAADVYSLGCVLYQLITGHPPFQGDDPTSILYQHVEVEPVLPPDLPAPVADLLRRMLAKEPGERPTAAEIAALDPSEAPTVELTTINGRRHWWRTFAALAVILAAGSVVTAGVLTDQESGKPTVPGVTPSQPPRTAVPPKPTTPVATTTKTVTRSTQAQQPAQTHRAKPSPGSQTDHPGKGKDKPKKSGKH